MRQLSEDNNHISTLPPPPPGVEQNTNKHGRKYSKYSFNWITGILSSLSLLTNSSQTSLAPHGRCFVIVIYCNNLSDNQRATS